MRRSDNILKQKTKIKHPALQVYGIVLLVGVFLGFALIGTIRAFQTGDDSAFNDVALPVQDQVASESPETESVLHNLEAVVKEAPMTLAIIFDDLGHNMKDIHQVLSLPFPVTISILPFTLYAKQSADLAKDQNMDILLHLPMEPHNSSISAGEHAITTEMTDSDIQYWVGASLEDVPYVIGVNNHMGSKATESSRIMDAVLQVLQARNLFFIDSVTSADSEGYARAQALNLPSAANECFLDHKEDLESIRDVLTHIDEKDQNQDGVVLIVAHPKDNTIRGLKEFYLYHSKEYRFVNLTQSGILK